MKKILEKNFDSLDFHDYKIYAIGFQEDKNELLVDVDFIEEWIPLEEEYTFRIFPATLVFANVWDVQIEVSMNINLIIDYIERSNPQIPRNIDYLPPFSKEYDWNIELFQGQIQFKSINLNIYQRKEIVTKKIQNFGFEERGGISLEKTGVNILHVV